MDASTAIALVILALVVGIYGSIIGAGGGFLIVAGLTLFFDLNGATAAGTSVITTLFIQLTGAYNYDKQGLVDRPSVRWFVVGSVPIAFLSGAFASSRIPARSFDLIVGVLLLTLAAFVITIRPPSHPDDERLPPKPGPLAAAGSLIGFLSGGLGVGAGLVTVPVLRWVQQLSAHRAAATTTAIGAISGVAAALGHTIVDNPEWSHIPFLVVGAVIGARIGSSNADRLSGPTVIALLAAGLIVAGIPLVARSV